MVDAAANFLGWSLDLWAHDTRIVQWGLTGWGRLADAAYYLDYNSLWTPHPPMLSAAYNRCRCGPIIALRPRERLLTPARNGR
ncbi:hypothetical protein [Mycobacterium sp.]|uniref:hypothetical protein n=1 Tax=Mycobacterium sp. TaxID=1785 RepID=UPI003F9BA7FD